MEEQDEDRLLRSVALKNAESILVARQRAEDELVRAKEALERKTEELARSLALTRATLESASDAILVTDGQTRVTEFNQKYVEMWEIPKELMDSREHRQLLVECARRFADPSRFLSRVEEIYEFSPPETSDVLELVDGRVIERFTRIQFVEDRNVGRVWSFRDITERKRAEETSARLAAIVEGSDDAIISKTLDGIITTWNHAAERMYGHTAAEAIGKPVTILFPPDRLEEEPRILEQLRLGELVDHYESVRVTKDGRRLNVSLTVSPIKDTNGKIIGASKIAHDITERKRGEEVLREETRVLELLNRTGTLIAAHLDLQALVQSITDAATQLTGARFGAFFYNVVNQHGESFLLYTLSGAPREAFDKFGMPRNTPLFGSTFRGEGIVRCFDVTQDPRYGTMSPHHGMPKGHLPVRSYLAVPVMLRSGEVIGGLFFGHPDAGIFTERTERIMTGVAAQAAIAIDNARLYEAERAARAEAERVSLIKDEFLATLSHELRTPLNAILGWSQVLRTRFQQDEDLEEGLSVIERNTKIQTQLIEDLLDMSRITSGKLRLDVQRVELQDVIKAAVASVRQAADAREIRLHVVLDPLAGPVRGDPTRLQQCVWNLLTNAIKFTSKGGRVQVSLQRVESHVEVCVVDTGIGVTPEFLPHVFERFRQLDATTTRKHGGLGLGLSIVKSLVELHGGAVRAESAGEGHGAVFCIELPLMVIHAPELQGMLEHPRGIPIRTSSIDHPSLRGITVLAVDDESDARELIRRVLEDCGARVLVAASSREGLEILRREKPDMILSDIGMPGEDGYEFIRQVRRLSPEEGGRTPAAALTAFARAEDRTRALRAGYQTHVTKPVETMELTAVVASLAKGTIS